MERNHHVGRRETEPDKHVIKLLVIDDDEDLCALLADYLTPERFRVHSVHDGESGTAAALSGEHEMVVLDVLLPGLGGMDVLRSIREQSAIPVLMLTARGDMSDRVRGLELGADDYLPKPFEPQELVARLRAVRRRQTREYAASAPIKAGGIRLDPRQRSAWLDDEHLDLTGVEFDLLALLMRRTGQVVPRRVLSESALGRELEPYDRSVDVHISSLRRKLGDESRRMIRTVRGAGYLFAQSHPESAEEKT